MAERFVNRADVAAKVEWEGGMEGALDYGLTVDDMPEGDEELQELWGDMVIYWRLYQEKAGWVENLLPDPGESS